MKAYVATKYGGPEVLELVELERPKVGPKEILVKIHATAVNSGDVRVRGLQVEGFLKVVMRLVLGFNNSQARRADSRTNPSNWRGFWRENFLCGNHICWKTP
jgi:hypothetical protein